MRSVAVLLLLSLIPAATLAENLQPDLLRSERSLHGRVLGPDGKPVAGAFSIKIDHVRTPGEGVISSAGFASNTDAEGRFSVYPVSPPDDPFDGPVAGLPPRAREHGDLVPLNSTYHIIVTVPGDDHFFPFRGEFRNTEAAVIHLQRPGRKRSFKFESPSGGFMTHVQLAGLSLFYQPTPKETTESLGSQYSQGGYVAPGVYRAEVLPVTFEPLTITADSPDELIFRLPPPITYRGRVIDAATGAPMAGVFVLGSESTGEYSLARLEREQWEALEKLSAEPDPKDPALKPVLESFGFSKIYRTDAAGNYSFLQTPAMGQTYGLVVFARDRLPLEYRLYDTKPGADHIATMPDIELFPAVRVKTQLNFNPQVDAVQSSAPSVMPCWEYDPNAKQPAWFANLKKIEGGRQQFACDHWLPIKTSTTIYIPAEVSLRLRLDVPYDDRWSAKEPDTLLKLAAGETKEIGAITFEPSMEVKLRVMSDTGVPVEGATVRRLDTRQNVWSIVHNTDARGEAVFFIRPRSTGEFGIIDLPGMQGGVRPANLTLRYEIGDKPPIEQPMMMKMTLEQVRMLRGTKPAGAV